MKLWLIYFLLIILVLISAFTFSTQVVKAIAFGVVFVSAIWVYKDSTKLNIARYKKTALSLSSSPFGSAFVVWFLWIIAFPMYIVYRQKIIDGKIPLKENN